MAIVAVIATSRFGPGARLGEPRRVVRDPRGWLHGQLAAAGERFQALPPGGLHIHTLGQGTAAELDRREVRRRLAEQISTARRRASVGDVLGQALHGTGD